ncbi:carbohydrate sulfotransferase 11 [Chironomus tepperi]|uniref:carbohydrate sulfotransferase 11 n=1 Tax=Chironomus tepperi TaxID=113505 RepID=UPI00391F7DAB
MRGNRTQCRVMKRCLVKCLMVFSAVSLLPFALIYLISTDQINRIKNYDFGNDTTVQSNDHPQSKPLTQNECENIESRMMLRNLHLIERCAFFGLDQRGNDSLHKPNSWEFLISKKYHLVWCNVFKAASTSWMYNFNLMAGYPEQFLQKSQMVPLSLARKKYPRPSVKELNEALNISTSFLITRHPFERLLSAYRDKLQYALPHTFHQKLGNMIVRKFRKPVSYERGDNTHHPLMNNAHSYLQAKAKKVGTRWPTFSEFVEFLLFEAAHDADLDMHWQPITNFCTPCQVHFDLILKFETLDEDQRYLIEKAGLTGIIKPEHRNSGKGKNTNEILMSFYAQLTKSQVKGLYNVFRHDFELFDYSPDEFIKIARDDDENTGNSLNGEPRIELNIDRSKLLPFS